MPRFAIHRSLSFAVAVAIVCSIVAATVNWRMALGDLDRLLSGDPKISVRRLEIVYQQRRVVCDDATVNVYLSDMMRRPEEAMGVGWEYYFTFDFSTGRRYSLHGGIVDATLFSLSVPGGKFHEPGFPTHHIVLRSPTPSRVHEVFNFLTLPWEEVGGLTLHVNENQPLRYEYVPSLHAPGPRGTKVDQLVNGSF